MFVHLTKVSSNSKVGKIPVSTIEKASCPTVCPFAGNGCYAEHGPLAIHWKKVSNHERGMQWSDYCKEVAQFPNGQLHRYAQAGDLPSKDQKHIDHHMLNELIAANNGRRGFTYTHYDMTIASNAAIVKKANDNGFTINLSANNLEHADQLANMNIGPVAVVVDSNQMMNTKTPQGRTVVICPAVVKDNVSCESCQLCQRQRKSIIGFPAHGSKKKTINIVVAK